MCGKEQEEGKRTTHRSPYQRPYREPEHEKRNTQNPNNLRLLELGQNLRYTPRISRRHERHGLPTTKVSPPRSHTSSSPQRTPKAIMLELTKVAQATSIVMPHFIPDE